MPDPTRSGRHQLALYYAKAGDNSHGEPTFSSRVELDVRWVKRLREVSDKDGNKVSTEATVKVDREILIDSLMWQGGEVDIPGTGTGDPTSGFYQVVTYDETPDIKGRRSRREVTLRRFNDGPPEIAT